MQSRRDADAFTRQQDNQKALQGLGDAGLVDLFYFDGSGFCSVPSVPYAWQPVCTVIELPACPSQRLNVLGFLSRDHRALFHAVPGQVAEAIDRFAAWRGNAKPCGVVLDNASWHTSRSIREPLDDSRRGSCCITCPLPARIEPDQAVVADNQIRLAAPVRLRELRQLDKSCPRGAGWRWP